MILTVNMQEQTYDVVVERNSLTNIDKYFDLNRKVLIVTDDGVPSEYSEKIKSLSKEGYIYKVPQGEASKSFSNFEKILDFLISKSFSRSDCVVACGGGVVGDLAGFVSSCYMRGIDFYNVPTTLLSQVDSSIGGKTAIDKQGIKNIIGAFYPPKKVLIDSNTLKTLDDRQLHAGLVEAIKMAATSDEELFTLIEQSNDLLSDIDEIIIKALSIKKYVVENDPKEKGMRKILNFGHTIGHAIESNSSYLHGECVGMGMLYLSSLEVRTKLEKILGKYSLPNKTDIDSLTLYQYITLDKKRSGDYLSIIYVDKIGTCEIKKILLTDIKKYL